MNIPEIIEKLDSIRDWITDNEGGSAFVDAGDLKDARREIDELKNELLSDIKDGENVPPKDLEPVLAKIQHINDLGKSNWYEVVYYNNNSWHSYGGSKTFEDGEKVTKWEYCKNCL